MSMRSPRSPFVLVLILSVFLAGISGSSLAQEKDQTDVIKVNTDLVVFDVQVIDKKTKQIISNLGQNDFLITEKGVPQAVTYFSRDELPLSILLLLDVSGSVRPILQQIRDGTLNALHHLKSEDEVAVMAFASESELVQDFTKDRQLVSERIKTETSYERLGGATFLGPALDRAATKIANAPRQTSRRVIIVITDNIAITTSKEEKQIVEELMVSGTVVYGLIVKAAIGKFVNLVFLGTIHGVNHFVEQTGGEIMGANKNEVDAKLAVVIDRLRARYALGFRPANSAGANEFHPVEITIAAGKQRKEKPQVLAKRGYYLRRR